MLFFQKNNQVKSVDDSKKSEMTKDGWTEINKAAYDAAKKTQANAQKAASLARDRAAAPARAKWGLCIAIFALLSSFFAFYYPAKFNPDDLEKRVTEVEKNLSLKASISAVNTAINLDRGRLTKLEEAGYLTKSAADAKFVTKDELIPLEGTIADLKDAVEKATKALKGKASWAAVKKVQDSVDSASANLASFTDNANAAIKALVSRVTSNEGDLTNITARTVTVEFGLAGLEQDTLQALQSLQVTTTKRNWFLKEKKVYAGVYVDLSGFQD
jgi:hypothetical protein